MSEVYIIPIIFAIWYIWYLLHSQLSEIQEEITREENEELYVCPDCGEVLFCYNCDEWKE